MKHIPLLEKLAPYLVLVVLILVGFIGFSWQEIVDLSKISTNKTETVTTGANQTPKLSINDLKGYAKSIGLNENDFNSCLDSGKYEAKVNRDLQYASEIGVSGTPVFFLNGHYIDGNLPYSDFKAALDFELNGGDWSKAPTSILNNVDSQNIDVDISGGKTKGDKNAKITLVEFGDFECPYCGDFFREAAPQIMKEYVDTGKVYFVYMNNPIFISHPYAFKAAEAGECASEQGKFWEMHDLMFKSHQS